MIHRAYFDSSGNSVDPAQAVACHEIETDEGGKVAAERNYVLTGTRGVQFNPDALAKIAEGEPK